MVPPIPGGSSEPQSQVKYIGLINIIGDPTSKDDAKLLAVQEISENFEIIMNSSQYPTFLDYALKTFIKFLLENKPHYVSEVNSQQVRKLLLELIYRFPTNKYLKAHVDSLLAMTFKLLKYENEQNMLVCLRIIIELHKHYRPPFNVKIQEFLKFVKTIYMELPDNINKIFIPKGDIRIKELTDHTMDEMLLDTFTTTPFKVDKKNPDGSPATDSNTVSYSLIPKGVQSLKVLHELPLIVVLMYEHYKENVRQEVTDYIPIIIKTITLQPSPQIRAMANFNKEVFVDFMGVQVKCLSFLAYIVKVYQETVGDNSEEMVEGILSMFSHCPHQVTHLRKELLIAARHILATDLKHLFVPHMGRLFDEDILLGRGWTTHESLRPLAYNTLADLVHHVKQQLPLSDLVKAVHLFSKNVHDETLPTGIQTVSCKLLLNLVDCIWLQGEKDPGLAKPSRELLMRMLHVFVLKFKVIAKLHLPILVAKSKQLEAQQKQVALAAALAQQQAQAQALAQQAAAQAAQPSQTQSVPPAHPQTPTPVPVPPIQIKKEEPDAITDGSGAPKTEEKETSKCRFGFPYSQTINYSITEYRNLVRTLVCGVKTISFRFKESVKEERDTEIFIKLVKWGLQALDIYTLSVSSPSIPAAMMQRAPQHQTVRSKDEKEVLEHFSGVFSVMDPLTFREIFTATIDYMVERIFNNLALQIICNSFLSSATTSPIFASVLVEYLLGRMSEMGNGNIAWSNLYLKLFKLVFGSVKMFAAKNEHMLRPHLHQIVNRSMELAMTAKEPFNYFLLLRTLFRSIGGGNHDLLYQEFLPLLPNLLQGLNSLQSGLHKQHMKDLFVELCLTVPVRLSSLLPYLPMLMDPLVSALNGSNILVISQGLRTLELCVDNLQPDFLYEHIQPVRAELMQALWRSLRSQDEELAQAAFRVLGKFGGGNRKMMAEPQKLEYVKRDFPSPSLMISFPEHTKLVQLPVDKVITTAVNILKPCNVNIFYRKQCWEVVKHYIFASMTFDDDINLVEKLFNNPSFKIDNVLLIQNHYMCEDKVARQTLVNALSGMFFGYIIKDLNDDILNYFDQVIKQFALVAISQQAGPVCQEQLTGMDAYVLIDAIAIVMAHDEKELCKPAKTAIHLILNTATSILGSKDKACQLDYFKYMAERMCALCYERAWYTKLGGCLAILYLFESMSIRWLYQHLVEFVKAQLFVIMDLTGEVSSGAIDQASSNLETLIKMCAPLVDRMTDPGLYSVQHEALAGVMCELIRLITSPTDLLRQQSMHLLNVFANAQGKSIVEVMEPHKAMIPPKKHLLRHQAANAQIGLMEGNTFCTSLTPRLFSLDLKESDHNTFFHEVLALCEASDASLSKYPCYKNLSSLVPLRKAALRALASCHYLTSMSGKIFDALYQSLDRPNQQLQEAAFEALKTFVQGAQVDMNMVVDVMRPLLSQLGDFRNLNHNGAQRLSYLVQLFPNSFNEKLCDQLLLHLSKLTETMLQSGKAFSKDGECEKALAIVIGIFGLIPAASAKFVEPLTQMVLQMEKDMLVGFNSPFRKPLIRFQLKFPKQTINLLLSDNNIKDEMWSKYLEYLIKSKDGKPFRDVLQSQAMVDRLITLAMVPTTSATLDLSSFLTPGCKENVMFFSAEEGLEVQYQSMRVVSLLVKFDDQWISNQHHLAQTFRQIWSNDQFLVRHKDIQKVDYKHWKEPKLIVKILLNYYSHHPDKIDLLFLLLRAFSDKILPDFHFLRTFLEMTVAQTFTCEWKRSAFFKFVELFHNDSCAADLKAKVIQYVLIPSFAVCFERGEGDKLVGSAPQPNEAYDEKNIISVFIFKVIDPENPFALGDGVRIALLQLSCLLVEQGLAHIHNAETMSQAQGSKLRRIMTYAWPCLLRNNCVDPATRYHGHLLFAHVISKFAMHTLPYKRIVLQVFNSLLKAHAVEVRGVVRQALEILTPSMPARMVGGYTMLTHWTKKIIVEEGHLMQQLFHILQLIVRHYIVYYPVRHHLISHMVTALQRLALSSSSSIEHRKLAVELAEIIIRWEVQRIKEEAQQAAETKAEVEAGQKRSASDLLNEVEHPPAKKPHTYKSDPSENRPLDRVHVDAVLNFLARLACQVNEPPQPGSANIINTSPGEVLSRRCYHLIRMALKPDVWNQQMVDIRVGWMEKLLATVGQNNANLGNICIALELLTFLITVMKEDQILFTCKALQKGLNACISSNNNKVIRVTHVFLTRLMSIFPTEPCASTVSSKHEELECIYSAVGRVVYEGLDNYEKNVNANSASLFGTVMMLKAACAFNPSYVDRLINHFVRVIHRMSREHMAAKPSEQPPGSVELLILSLDLVKNRVGVMTGETKKTFIGSILVGLIEKTQEIKVMRAICSMVEEWMKNSKVQPSGTITANTNCGPTLREKSILLVKLMQYVEKRFPDLNTQFLELINYIYKDETFKNSELIPKLEPAFLAGLRCTHPQIREKFFEIFDNSIRRRVHDRLMYIVSSQNWEPMGHHYWLKQCIELILVSSDQGSLVQLSSETPLLPSVTSVVYQANTEDRESFLNSVTINVEPMEIDEKYDPLRDIGGVPLLSELIADHKKFADTCKKLKAANLLRNISQLCHHDTALTEKIWLDVFPRLWQVLSDRQRAALSGELLPFLVSGVHVTQKDIHPSSVSTIFEALSNCNPPIQLKPGVMSYLGKSHNLWHRVTLGLEKILAEQMNSSHQAKQRRDVLDCYDFEPDLVPHQAGMEHLAEMYSQLREEDMWVGLWTKHCRYKETAVALAYEQQGYFEKALGAYELVLGKGRQDFINTPAPLFLLAEERLWEKGWIRCSKELNQWKHLLDYAKTKGNLNPYLILESAWRIPDWDLMKEAINHVETSCPKDLLWKVHLYRGYLAICHPDEQHLPIVERYVELASSLIMKEWRRLPHVVSHIHLPLLQAAQQIMELQEACLIHQALSHDSSYLTHEQKSSLHDMKAIVKTWRNRLPIVGDDLCHWSDIFTWRQHHYQYINDHYVTQSDQGTEASTHSMFGVHSSVQALIHFAKIARKHNLTRVCLDLLARIYTIPQVPIKDCFQKIRQQLKCYLQMALQSGNKELQEGLEVAESTNLNYFTKEVTSEFYALKGKLFSQMGGRSEDANKAFSAAVQQHDTLVKAWAFWGDFIEEQFTKSPNPDIQTGVCAITCFLHACRHQNESKSRKYLAKVLWLLTYDDANNTLAAAVDKYVVGVPPVQWLPWIPQLLTCLIRNEGNSMLNLLSQVARMYPQAVYFPLRTLYLTLKIEQMERERERYKNAELAATLAAKQGVQPKPADQGNAPDGSGPIKATPAMWRCSKIMQKDIHPTVLSSLEGLVDQMVWFRETWYEEVLRQLRQGLTKCYVLAFENRGAVTEATITPHTLHFVKKLKSTFGLGIENPSGMNSSNSNQSGTQQSNSSLSESLAKRYEVTLQDPIFQPMKEQFSAEFDFTVPGAMKLQNLIQKLKKWIKILEAKTKLQPKSFLIEEKCRFLSNFTLQTAEMELPGEFLLPKHSHYFVRISRFMPRVEIVQKHNTAARRLYIRGHNGKIYPYLVVNDSGLGDARREERVLQLLRMINHYFPKQKETAKRLLQVTVPRVVAVLPQMRLVEDNPCSLSLLDIYRSACSTRDTDHDAPVTKYYDKLASIQARGMQASLPNLKEILKDVQTSLVPKTLLKEWAVNTYPSPTDYWTFRKMLTLQLSLACFCEYVLHLTRLNPDMMYLHQDSGLLNVSYFKFNVDDMKGELDANRPVPFRLTPNIQELLTDTGINGPLTASMIAAARCLSYPNFKVTTILKAILRDEMIFAHKKQKQEEQQAEVPPGTAVAAVGGEQIIKMVTNAVDSISDRLNSLANFDDAESKVTTLVVAARNADNLCRMDPAWHPWL